MNSRERRPQAGRNLKLASSLAAVILASSLPAPSATAADDQWAPLSSKTELRAGALVHDVPFTGPGIEYGGVDLNLEAVFPRLPIFQDTRFRSLVPRPQIGGTANFFDNFNGGGYAAVAGCGAQAVVNGAITPCTPTPALAVGTHLIKVGKRKFLRLTIR